MTKRGRPPANDVLTPAEWRTVELVRHGLTNPKIAALMGISADAVKYHVANALLKLGFRNRREVRLWDGVRRDSAMARGGTMMDANVQLGPLGQVSRSVRDIAAAEAWYRDVAGLPHLYTFGKLAFFDCGGTRLFLSEVATQPADSILYFRVHDIHAAVAALTARGAHFVSAPHMIHRHADGTEEWMAFFNDNEGRPLALMAQVRDAVATS